MSDGNIDIGTLTTNVNTAIREHRDRLVTINNGVNQLRDLINRAAERLQQFENNLAVIESNQKEIKNLTERLTEANNTLTMSGNDKESEIAKLNEQIRSITEEKSRIEGEYSKSQQDRNKDIKKNEDLELNLRALQNELNTANQAKNNIEETQNNINQKIKSLEELNNKLTNDQLTCKTNMDSMKVLINKATEELKSPDNSTVTGFTDLITALQNALSETASAVPEHVTEPVTEPADATKPSSIPVTISKSVDETKPDTNTQSNVSDQINILQSKINNNPEAPVPAPAQTYASMIKNNPVTSKLNIESIINKALERKATTDYLEKEINFNNGLMPTNLITTPFLKNYIINNVSKLTQQGKLFDNFKYKFNELNADYKNELKKFISILISKDNNNNIHLINAIKNDGNETLSTQKLNEIATAFRLKMNEIIKPTTTGGYRYPKSSRPSSQSHKTKKRSHYSSVGGKGARRRDRYGRFIASANATRRRHRYRYRHGGNKRNTTQRRHSNHRHHSTLKRRRHYHSKANTNPDKALSYYRYNMYRQLL